MAQFTLREVIAATHGQTLLQGPQPVFTGVSTDTRTLRRGDLFIAIKGEHFNGHAFLDQACAAGAAGALVEDEVPGVRRRRTDCGRWTIVEVIDTLYALGKLAQYHRDRFTLPVVGITGSAGKTTTKEMTAVILEQGRRVLKSEGNFNNEIGLPHTLFALDADHQVAVLEFGMRGRGQIAYLAALARPTIGAITNIGLTHLELLGSPEEIALAKAELLDEMAPGAPAVLPGDDAFTPLLRAHACGSVTTVGLDASCDLWADAVTLDDDGCAAFTLRRGDESMPVRLGTPGGHQVRNALTAAAAALAAGATPGEVQTGLAAYRPSPGRMHTLRAARGFTVVDDTYNANPTAMRAVLDFLAAVPGGKKVAILGDMRELGPTAAALHREIGAYALSLGIDALFAIGELGREYIAAYDSRACWFPDHDAAAAAARDILTAGDVVLVKGSRTMRMERIVQALMQEC